MLLVSFLNAFALVAVLLALLFTGIFNCQFPILTNPRWSDILSY